jgi:enoyl-CoA hydratase/carnithine racemase
VDYAFFQLEKHDGVGRITINRPPANAMSVDFLQELGQLLEELEKDPEVRAVLFRSALPKYFMAGMDLKSLPPGVELGGLDPSMGPQEVMKKVISSLSSRIVDVFGVLQASLNKLEALPKPTVAAINGHALGGGLEFSLCCDFRIMARGAGTIGLTEVNLGFLPAAGGTQRLTRLLGRGKAIEMILLSRRIAADEAAEIGLIYKAVELEELDLEGERLACELARRATRAIAKVKQCVYGSEDCTLAEGLALENKCLAELMLTEDMVEGISSFVMGNRPEYKGR